MTTQKKLILAAGVIGIFYFYQKQQAKNSCEDLYKVNNNKVCYDKLNELGYYYWLNAPTGSGYYNLSYFNNAFNYPIDQFEKALIQLLERTNNLSDPGYNTAQSFLTTSLIPGSLPLQNV